MSTPARTARSKSTCRRTWMTPSAVFGMPAHGSSGTTRTTGRSNARSRPGSSLRGMLPPNKGRELGCVVREAPPVRRGRRHAYATLWIVQAHEHAIGARRQAVWEGDDMLVGNIFARQPRGRRERAACGRAVMLGERRGTVCRHDVHEDLVRRRRFAKGL